MSHARTFALRLLVAAAGWWILNEGRAISVSFSAIVILSAVICGMRVSDVRPVRWHLRGLFELAGVFLIGSLRGGIDVARRAFARSMPIDPAMIEYELLEVPAGPGAHIFTGALSMAPGSLVVAERGACLDVHVLVQDNTTQRLAARFERSIVHAVGEERTHA